MQYQQGYIMDERYQLTRFLGSGSFGEVWVARDMATDIDVAIKIYISMDDQGLSDFKKEFQLSFNFHHTNLLHANYLGVNSSDSRPFLVMPLCPDGSVTKFMGKMSEEQMWEFIRDVAAGLNYLHRQTPPVIHQDIKPDNILIMSSGDYVITDFGISKQLRSTLRKSASTLDSAGAVSYMGPERFSRQSQAIKASDIWSLGASIYELATGELPFCGMGGSMQKKGADTPELPAEFSDQLNWVTMACMAKEPWDRPTAAQLFDYVCDHLRGTDAMPEWLAKAKAESSAAEPAPASQPAPTSQPAPVPTPKPQPAPAPTPAPKINLKQTVTPAKAQAEELPEIIGSSSDIPKTVMKSQPLEDKPSVLAIAMCAVCGIALGIMTALLIF